MVNQGDIIKISFNPQMGHEQAGYRPAIVVSTNAFQQRTGFIIACPITNTNRQMPLHVPLKGRTKTTGVIMCDQIKAMDLRARKYSFVEHAPDDVLDDTLDIILLELQK